MLYNKCMQKETKFIPLNIRPERKKLLEDWNEVLAIITEMKVVPEEADQVSFIVNVWPTYFLLHEKNVIFVI